MQEEQLLSLAAFLLLSLCALIFFLVLFAEAVETSDTSTIPVATGVAGSIAAVFLLLVLLLFCGWKKKIGGRSEEDSIYYASSSGSDHGRDPLAQYGDQRYWSHKVRPESNLYDPRLKPQLVQRQEPPYNKKAQKNGGASLGEVSITSVTPD